MWFDAVLILLLAAFGLAIFYRDRIRQMLEGTPTVLPPPVDVPPPYVPPVPVEPPFDVVLTPARALALHWDGVQDGRFYAYLNGLSLVNRKVWLAEFLRLAKVKDGEGGQIINDVVISNGAWQIISVLTGTYPGCGRVDFYGV